MSGEKDRKGLPEGNDRCKAMERGTRHEETRGRGEGGEVGNGPMEPVRVRS